MTTILIWQKLSMRFTLANDYLLRFLRGFLILL